MSAGGNLRRGYAYGVPVSVDPRTHETYSPSLFSLLTIALMIVMVAAIASDPHLVTAIGRALGTAWSDFVGLLLGVLGR
ncbi:MAG TPA: hypothetical protein VIA63_02710 [Candidatus Limnocylindria bacterium]|jgi:hypothetical protein